MPRLRGVRALLGLLASVAFPGAAGAQASTERTDSTTLEIRVIGVRSAEGSVRLALFDEAPRFTDEPARSVVLAVGDGEGTAALVWHVRVPHGTFAVAAVHDRNDNERLDTNFLGMPREPYGFSNGARGAFGPPSFDDAAFEARGPVVRVDVPVG